MRSSPYYNIIFAVTLLLFASPLSAESIETKSVEVNGKIQQFSQIPYCTALKVPLGKNGVQYEIKEIVDVKNLLISSVAFNTCEDVASLSCPKDASYCKQHKFDKTEVYNIKKSDFSGDFAYLYALPVKETKVSFEIKFSAIDSTTETKLAEVDGKFHQFTDFPYCTALKIPVGKNGVKYEIKEIKDVKNLLISSVPFTTCDDVALLTCPKDATYCKEHKFDKTETSTLKKSDFSGDYAYLYALPVKETKVSFEIMFSSVPTDAGDTKLAEVDSKFHQFTQHPYCTAIKVPIGKNGVKYEIKEIVDVKNLLISSVAFKTCEDVASLSCPKDASYCKQHKFDKTETATLKKSDFSGDYAYLYALPVKEIKVSFEIKFSAVDGSGSTSPPSTFWRILNFIFMLGVLVFVGSVCYYRYQYHRYHYKAFDVPQWCPNFLFPRASDPMGRTRFISLEPTNKGGDNYEPPMAVL